MREKNDVSKEKVHESFYLLNNKTRYSKMKKKNVKGRYPAVLKKERGENYMRCSKLARKK